MKQAFSSCITTVSALALCAAAGTVSGQPLSPTAPEPSTAAEQTAGQEVFLQFHEQAAKLVSQMTLAEKVGQMTQAELGEIAMEDIESLALGSVLSGGGSDPAEGNTLQAWTDAYDKCQKIALGTRLGIPLLYGIDAVHGHNNVLGATIFPHNIGLGCTRNPDLIEKIAEATALEVRATGIQWAFAPCVTVPRDDRWGRTYEGFSEEPGLVTALGVAAVRGLQGDSLASSVRVLGCAKHFAGDGGTIPEMRDSPFEDLDPGVRTRLDQGDVRCDEQTFRNIHIAPYRDAITAGVGSVMPSYSSWNGVKCTGNRWLLTDVLKGELGFEGFVITDYNAIDQVTPDYKQAIKICINAGVDMAMVPKRYAEYHRLLMELVEEGEVSQQRIDDAVTRILRVKAAMGLLDKQRSPLANRDLQIHFGAAKHRELARQAVRESLVLLKNDNAALPITKDVGKIVVCGSGANDLGRQCGGWTIDWQGKEGEVTTGGATILDAMLDAARPGQVIEHATDLLKPSDAEVTVVVASEPPYAEGIGDKDHPRIPDADLKLVQAASQSDSRVILVVLSGRPIDLGAALEAADAVVAAWLPGTRGEGVVDVLTGAYPPTGKLSFTWNSRLTPQEPINVGEENYHPLFSYGHGLTYERFVLYSPEPKASVANQPRDL